MIHICELFSGIGAQTTALKNVGIEHDSICCEIDAKAYASYCAIHGDTPNLGDITKVERLPARMDLVTYSYPCIRGDQEVLSKRGFRSIKDIKVGDKVLTHKWEWHEVTAHAMTGIKKTVRVIVDTMGRYEVVCTPEHLFMLDDGTLPKDIPESEASWEMACNLKGKSIRCYKKMGEPFSATVSDVVPEDDAVEVYDISVEGDNSFICNGVVVHNCQDLSIAGSQKGMEEGSGTRSSLLWEVGRLLKTAKEEGDLPKYLLMENVPAVTYKKNIDAFKRWIATLSELGYTSSYAILNAKDYGVPQNRQRCFMVSSLDGREFIFPEPCPDGRVLKDILQPPEEVPDKCWLSPERIAKYEEHYKRCQEKGNGFGWNPTDGSKVGKAVTTSPDRQYSNMLIQAGTLNQPGHECINRVYDTEGISPTVTTPSGGGHLPKIKWPSGTSKGYMDAQDGDGLVMARPTLARGTVQPQQSPTVTCGNTTGCVQMVRDTEQLPEMHDGDVCAMLTPGRIEKRQNGRRFKEPDEPSFTVTTQDRHGIAEAIEGKLRIRYITALEAWRLQGFSDEAYYKAKAVPMSDTQLYKQAGNSIAVPCLEAIFKSMFLEDSWKDGRQKGLDAWQ